MQLLPDSKSWCSNQLFKTVSKLWTAASGSNLPSFTRHKAYVEPAQHDSSWFSWHGEMSLWKEHGCSFLLSLWAKRKRILSGTVALKENNSWLLQYLLGKCFTPRLQSVLEDSYFSCQGDWPLSGLEFWEVGKFYMKPFYFPFLLGSFNTAPTEPLTRTSTFQTCWLRVLPS